MALLEVHDSVRVESRDGSAVIVVRRVQFNEAAITLTWFALLGYVTFLVANGYVRYAIVAALLLLAATAVVRAFRIRVETSKERVRVLNYWRTFEFAWNDAGGGASRKCAVPKETSSPGRSVVSAMTRAPLTYVPLTEARSRSSQPSGLRVSSACRRDTVGSVKTQSQLRERPSKTFSRVGRTRYGVRALYQASVTRAAHCDAHCVARRAALPIGCGSGRSAVSTPSSAPVRAA
jgi:hypothetical protein